MTKITEGNAAPVRAILTEVPGTYELLITRNPRGVGAEWPTFNGDGLVVGDFAGPGPIKEEFRDPIKRILRDLGS